jgi:sarcosine oxidase subunit delta
VGDVGRRQFGGAVGLAVDDGGGQAHVRYPDNPAGLDDETWARYVFFRDNPKGPFAERWVHSAGCRRWFNAVRDTGTHQLLRVYPIGEAQPGVAR